MKCARPLSVVVVIVAFAMAALAADDKAGADQIPGSAQFQAADLGPNVFADANGVLFATAHPVTPGERSFKEKPLAKLDHGVCYTLRMYKVKPTERLSDGETGRRGYTTCEMASNYQYRSAVVHPSARPDRGNK